MKCTLCDGKGEYMHAIGGYRPCEHCNGTGEIEVTNEEWFNSLPTEEKAEFYAKLTLGCYKCGAKGSHNIKNCGFDYCLCSKRDFVMWLKQPHREGMGRELCQ